jgi:hypothetical protein
VAARIAITLEGRAGSLGWLIKDRGRRRESSPFPGESSGDRRSRWSATHRPVKRARPVRAGGRGGCSCRLPRAPTWRSSDQSLERDSRVDTAGHRGGCQGRPRRRANPQSNRGRLRAVRSPPVPTSTAQSWRLPRSTSYRRSSAASRVLSRVRRSHVGCTSSLVAAAGGVPGVSLVVAMSLLLGSCCAGDRRPFQRRS